MSPSDKPRPESWVLSDYGDEQPARTQVPALEAGRFSSEDVDNEEEQQTDERTQRRQTGRLILQPIISVKELSKTYASGLQALKNIDLDIRRGEIFALLGPNGAGKTTLINIICGIVNPTEGVVRADGHDIVSESLRCATGIGSPPSRPASPTGRTTPMLPLTAG